MANLERLPGSAASADSPRLRIVAVNDVYLLDHLPKLRGLVERLRAEAPEVPLLVTMAGDFVAPSLLSSLDAGRGMVDCMNAVGFTHVCFGNHEDDIDPAELSQRVRELEAPCLGTNVRGFEPELPCFDVIEVKAPQGRTVRVGLLGVVMDDLAVYQRVPFGGATLLPPNATVIECVQRLQREQGCEAVIALTHQPIALDRELLARAAELPLPLILGGHEHQVFLEEHYGGWLIKAGSDAVHAAVIELVWPATAPGDGAPARPQMRVELLDTELESEDAALAARVAHHMKRVEELASATLMVLPEGVTLSSKGTRNSQTSIGTLLATRVRETLGADVCVLNGGGVRGARDYRGAFTYGALETEVPFSNEAVCVCMPAVVLERAILASRRFAPHESGSYFQLCDRMRMDGERLRFDGELTEPAQLLRVALVRNLFDGMDNVEPLIEFARQQPAAIPPPGSGRDIKLVLLESFARALWHSLGPFELLDRNGDGAVDASDLEQAIATQIGGRADVAAGIVMRVLDQDKDDRISWFEVGLDQPPQRGK